MAKWAAQGVEAAKAEAAGLRAKATAARERADSFKNDLIEAGANAEAFPRSVQVVWGEDGLPSVKRLVTPRSSSQGLLTPPPPRSSPSGSSSSTSSSDAPAPTPLPRVSRAKYSQFQNQPDSAVDAAISSAGGQPIP